MHILTRTCAAVGLAASTACAGYIPYTPDPAPLDAGRLPPPDAALTVPHLTPCTDTPDRELHLNTGRPVTVLVHGCDASAGRFRSLAQLYAFHGQQAVCFEYDDRDSLLRTSDRLGTALGELVGHMRHDRLTVIGHSMGGLVVRKTMERGLPAAGVDDAADIRLATVSAPIAGIRSSRACGSGLLQWLSLGTVPAACWMITGSNWREITPSSVFIRRPGPLASSVRQYLKVVTDERDTCRRRNSKGACVESDFVFTRAEQYHAVIDGYRRLVNVEVDAGHAAIVGTRDNPPYQLVSILQEQGLMARTPPERRVALERLLADLY